MDGSQVTDNNGGDNNPNPPPPAPANPGQNVVLPQQTFIDLTQAINQMREERILQGTMNNNDNSPQPNPNQNSNAQPNPPPPVRNIRNSSLNYYPDIDELCRHLYLHNPSQMETKSGTEWLKSLYTLDSILRCNWILDEPPIRPDDVTEDEQHQITIALTENFAEKFPQS